MRNEAVIALIAEMKAKLANPDAGELTIELATLTLRSVTPMLNCHQMPPKPLLDQSPTIHPSFHTWALEALQSLPNGRA